MVKYLPGSWPVPGQEPKLTGNKMGPEHRQGDEIGFRAGPVPFLVLTDFYLDLIWINGFITFNCYDLFHPFLYPDSLFVCFLRLFFSGLTILMYFFLIFSP